MSGRRPQLEVVADAATAAARAAELIAARVVAGRARVLGLATGGTMVPLYAHLVAAVRAGRLSLSAVTSFNLDEYVGVAPQMPASFHAYMRLHLLDEADLDPARAHVPDGMAPDLTAEASRYEMAITRAGGIDLQVLGIGANGHIGFNEPGSDFGSRTRVLELSEATRRANAADFPDGAVPERALTMGIATILEAREIVLLAIGAKKAAAIAAAIEGPLSPNCPASALRLHAQVRIICDKAAASQLDGPQADIRRQA
ncbi:glucosamine-6-phosphate deaminase [Bosea caraganae]|uniref:Glucosamine-6-phosphate deaminase n=1 Tax=Bosea caraganae TaxID=2763117 RepID=A0A370LD25_9HYPH|nr:glucosamine-6-phosphate deaminase [Bosea caraganae]RDJ27785.1 glucosamine-6-phosphate deaminase [Bosea caraganae]RDJ29798.1 glucosamine-6-phosphate deaminase [Bosea caraganae]